MSCVLCQQNKKLCNSHVIPEFAYKVIYDEKHRAIAFSPIDSTRTKYIQKGIRSKLLCEDCEGFINDNYEKPFKAFWLDGDALARLSGQRAGILTGIDYTAFKLFHLRILFLAHHSKDPNFAEINIGEHETAIRKMIIHRSSGESWEYPIVCSAIEKPNGDIWDDWIEPAYPIDVGSQKAFLFTFGGCHWYYFLSSVLTIELDKLCLKATGELPVVKKGLLTLDRHRAEVDAYTSSAAAPPES